jgi:hypothetical protein
MSVVVRVARRKETPPRRVGTKVPSLHRIEGNPKYAARQLGAARKKPAP